MSYTMTDFSVVDVPGLVSSQRSNVIGHYYTLYESEEYVHRRFDFDGLSGGLSLDKPPKYGDRKPAVTLGVTRIVTHQLTAFMMGNTGFPNIKCQGDDDAEDYLRELIRVSKFRSKFQTARNIGGACGTAVMGYEFVNGKPRVQVYKPQNIHVLEWADRYEMRPRVVIECTCYDKDVAMSDGQKKTVKMYQVRRWDETTDTIWNPVSDEQIKQPGWHERVEHQTVTHGFGECPIYLVQNLDRPGHVDGYPDCYKLDQLSEALDMTYSFTHKATKGTMDPTLVIHDRPENNEGPVGVGHNNALYSEKGAKYLEISGTSMHAGLTMGEKLLELVSLRTGVVLGNPAEIAGKALSSKALKIMHQRQISRCDLLREQYGDFVARFLEGLLRACRTIEGQAPGSVYQTDDGRLVQERPTVVLPPRVDPATGVMTPRNPGVCQTVTVTWSGYFDHTPADVQQEVASATNAAGAIITTETATRYVAGIFGIENPDEESVNLAREQMTRAEMLPSPERYMPEVPEPAGDDAPDSARVTDHEPENEDADV